MTTAFRSGQKVSWQWGSGTGEGRVREVFREKTTRTIKGATITRHGSDDCPAYRIEQDDGDEVLKLHSELTAAS